MSNAVRDAAYEIVDRARGMAPVDTGALRESIYAATDTQSEYGAAAAHARSLRPNAEILPAVQPTGPYEAAVGVAVSYWTALEFGTMRQAAQPFITPAVESVREKFERDMQAALQEGIDG